MELISCLTEPPEFIRGEHQDIKKNLTLNTFYKYRLRGMMIRVFGDSPYEALNNAYPSQFKPWELLRTPKSYWNKETAITATKWLIEEKLKWDFDTVKNNLNHKVFVENNLGGMISVVYGDSSYNAINDAFPNKLKPWEMKMSPMGLWNKETGISATKWLIEEVLKWDRQEICKSLSQKEFIKNGLSGMLSSVFNNSPFLAIDALYPNEFKPWELRIAPFGFWNEETGISATKWLIEEKLKWSDDDIKTRLSLSTFTENGLGGMLDACFGLNPFRAILKSYPERFQIWELKTLHKNYWNEKNTINALNWLIDKKLNLALDKHRPFLSKELLIENGLESLLKYYSINNLEEILLKICK